MIRNSHSLLAVTLLAIFSFFGCTPHPTDVQKSGLQAPIYPDYTDVTLPPNIAPLNMLVRGDIEAVELVAQCGEKMVQVNSRGNEIVFDQSDWRDLMASSVGHDINVTVTALSQGKWTEYKEFKWSIATDSIDSWLTYRLIEPDYEVFHNLVIEERCIENFDTRPLSSYDEVGNRCMNCHTHSQQPDVSMMYVRGEGGGAVFCDHGKLRKLNLKTDDMEIGSVYFGFSPSSRYAVFSNNIIIPSFHSLGSKRMEVFDKMSNIYVADLQNNTIITSPLLSDSLRLETFPTFSPDGKFIYYCTAPDVKMPEQREDLQYSLCRIAWDEQKGEFGTVADTIISARKGMKQSVCHPRISPDGKWLLYTVADYGTFPIWHRETDLRMMNLATGAIDSLAVANSDMSDTYHSWSSNSRWFVFASKRDDGLYGKPYFCYVDRQGRVHKPFVLPQRSPLFYDNCLKSFNVPDLGTQPAAFDIKDVVNVLKGEAEGFQ